MKKFLLVSILLLSLILILAGCGSSGGSGSPTATPGPSPTVRATQAPTPTPTTRPTATPTPSPTPTLVKIAYIYDSVDSPACTTLTTLLSGYSVTQIAHDLTTITTPSLSSYGLIIIADQANYWEYDQSLANTIINAGKPIIAMGISADYFYMNQNVVTLSGLQTCGSGTGLTQVTIVDSGNPIRTTPNSIGLSPVTVFSTGHGYHAVTKPNWPGSFATNGVSIATPIGSPTWHIFARESEKYFFWGLWGSLDDLTITGKNLFKNTVYYMLNY